MPDNANKKPNAKPPVLKLRQKQQLFVVNKPMTKWLNRRKFRKSNEKLTLNGTFFSSHLQEKRNFWRNWVEFGYFFVVKKTIEIWRFQEKTPIFDFFLFQLCIIDDNVTVSNLGRKHLIFRSETSIFLGKSTNFQSDFIYFWLKPKCFWNQNFSKIKSGINGKKSNAKIEKQKQIFFAKYSILTNLLISNCNSILQKQYS